MKLIGLTFGAILLFAAAILITLLSSHSNLLPFRFTQLHFDKCKLPCWVGITPGVTTHSDAAWLLRDTFSPADDAQITDTDGDLEVDFSRTKTYGSCFSVFFETDQSSVITDITFMTFPHTGCNTLTLWDTIFLFGPPTFEIDDTGSHGPQPQVPAIVYTTGFSGVFAQFKFYPGSKTANLDVLTLDSGGEILDPTAKPQPWRGIARFNRG